MKAVDYAVSQILPEDLRQPSYDLSKNGMAAILTGVASKYPEQFRVISKRLGDLGRNAAWYQGYSTTAADTLPVINTSIYYKQMDAELAHLGKQRKTLDTEDFEEQRDDILQRYSDIIEKETMKASAGNAFSRAVVSGARGNPAHVKAILSTPGIYTDSKGRIIPLFVRNSFSGGVRPAEMLAGTYGARLSVTSTKRATAKGGDLLKLWNQNVSNYNVTAVDCGTDNGLDFAADDDSLSGRVLARPVGDIPAGSVIDRTVLGAIRKSGKPIIARSSMTCRAKHGICAKCAGVQADGRFAPIGESLGITAASAIGEPIVQGSLNCLVEGTMVRMADYTTRRIEEVVPGEFVIGADIYGNTFPVEVLALHNQGMQPVTEFTYKLGTGRSRRRAVVGCTDIHEILQVCDSGELPSKLPAGISATLTSPFLPISAAPPANPTTPDFAGLLGFWLGDGIRWSGKSRVNGTIKMSCADADVASDLQKDAKAQGFNLRKLDASHDWVILDGQPEKAARNARGHQVAGQVLHRFKQAVINCGWRASYCHEKLLPPDILSWDDLSLHKFIAGFWSADGSTYTTAEGYTGVSLSSTSKRMLEQLRDVLEMRCCIYTSELTRIAIAGTGNRKNDQWQITIRREEHLQTLATLCAPYVYGAKGRLLVDALKIRRPRAPIPYTRRISAAPAGVCQCWDLSVNHPDELFVLANHLIVSNTKHNAGMAKGKKTFSGLDTTIQFVQIPDEFKDRAAVAEEDGVVESINEAPQGGTYVTVNGRQHFVLPGFSANVKVGEKVEAGDIISDGLASPADIVRLRGLGEGRRYYADRLGQILHDSGNKPDKRHMELVARAVVDDYRIDDPGEDSPYLPDDSVRENEFLETYKPPADTSETLVDKSIGGYLQKPVLHYTVGTRVTPKIADRMRTAGVQQVLSSRETPWYTADMKRLRVASHDSKDWLVGLGTSYLSSQMRDSLERGDETNVQENYHYGPRLAYGGDAGKGAFGENVRETGMF
jgi:hypothetical protein